MSETDTEKSNPIGRLKRYANVTSAVGGLAARMAGERYLGIKIDRENHAKVLTEALGGLKGPLMKVAQILSTIPDDFLLNIEKNYQSFKLMLLQWDGFL